MMTISQVRHRVIQNTGDSYYDTVNQLKEDLEFFSMYIARNKKSRLGFMLIPFAGGAFRCYKDVYGAYGYYHDANAVENTYCICSLMDSIFTDIYHESNDYTAEEIVDFAEFLKDELGLKLEDYVSVFIGCSHGVAGVRKKLYEILYGEEQEMDDLVRRSDVLKTLADASINGYITHKINAIAPVMRWIPCSVELPEVYKPVYIWMVPKKDGYLSDARPQKRLAYYSDMSAHFHDMGTQKIIPDDFDIPYWMDIDLIPPPNTD